MQISSECEKLFRIAFFFFILLCDWSEKNFIPFNQSDLRVNKSLLGHLFFPGLQAVYLFLLLSYWSSVVISFPLIHCSDYFGFGFMTQNQHTLFNPLLGSKRNFKYDFAKQFNKRIVKLIYRNGHVC